MESVAAMAVIVELPERMPLAHAVRALEREPGLAVLATRRLGAHASARPARSSFVLARPVERVTTLAPPPSPPDVGWAGLPAAPRWVGAIPYEAGRDRERATWCRADERPSVREVAPEWLRYDAALRIDADSGALVVEADDAAAAGALVERLRAGATDAGSERPFELEPLPDAEPPAAHAARIARALERIAAGDVYQVNLARFLHFRAHGSRAELFLAMLERSPVEYGFYGQFFGSTVCGASPELALHLRDRRATTGPIKGTRARGASAAEDEARAAELDASDKERAELTMAIDLHRNDLGILAEPGSVRLSRAPHIVRGARVMRRVAEVSATLRADVSLVDAVRAFAPAGSVTGAPKVRAMEIIEELEAERRGLYTGLYGHVGRDGALTLAVAIRTLVVDEDGAARYGAGGGIVAGSDPSLELDETRWKASHLEGLGG